MPASLPRARDATVNRKVPCSHEAIKNVTFEEPAVT